ncbi:MAG TPA: hypothetical protein VH879_10610 [Gemmatimonadales bacterium]|jgi:hypothetical protein
MPSTTRIPALVLGLLGGAVVPELAAQSRPGVLPDGSTFAVTVNRLTIDGFSDEPLTGVALRFAGLRRNALSWELGAAVMADQDLRAASLELGPAFNLSLPGATLLIRGGGTGIVAASGDGGGGAIGAYAGMGLLFRVGRRVGLRFDLARHWYAGEGTGAWQFGAGFALLPRIR